jgi:alpha-galactosidase
VKLRRRSFLGYGGMAAALHSRLGAQASSAFLDVVRSPDRVTIYTEQEVLHPKLNGTRWQAKDVEVTTAPHGRELPIIVSAPRSALLRLHLRWLGTVPEGWRYLGDQWERSYGDLEWRGLSAERVMPWYFLATNGKVTNGYGVKTLPSAFCFWQVDAEGISLWLDVQNGGSGVRLGDRALTAAVVTAVQGQDGVSPYRSAQALCRTLCPHPINPEKPVYGFNNWYYTYGKGLSAPDILRDSELVAALSPEASGNRPFMLIDMGWGAAPSGAGPMDHSNERFPDMPGLAAKMKALKVRPGIWVRPLLTAETLAETWRIPANQLGGRKKSALFTIDPSIPEALAHIGKGIHAIRNWGYEMIKYDFSTFDILGRWGFQMGASVTSDGWHFADRSKTTAEVITGLYRAVREAAGSVSLIGCNTVGHLGAGLFELHRIGDDNSGRDWNRTRRMGVNTLGFRMAQHNAFFAADADCVPITKDVPWEMTRQWLDLLANSGTPLFVSADPATLGTEQRNAIRRAMAAASRPQPSGEPLDWMETATPRSWLLGGRPASYKWFGEEGVFPFST